MGGDAQEKKDEVGGWLDGKKRDAMREGEKNVMQHLILPQLSDGRTE